MGPLKPGFSKKPGFSVRAIPPPRQRLIWQKRSQRMGTQQISSGLAD
ncbi:MAG: hypothetical protein F6J93_30340 [Oscillatoria sp. SIO1A7]|nr:hypothetical protein [Oscillatoria sp. SIO1A7]